MLLLAASPMLETFSLDIDCRDPDSRLDMLMQEFHVWQTNPGAACTTSTYLRNLKLFGIPVQLSTIHVRRLFQNLKHLTLSHRLVIGLDDYSYTMEQMDWEGIWDALTEAGSNEGLWLETLHTAGVQPPKGFSALFKYLLAHPGLKGLSILHPPFDNIAGDQINPPIPKDALGEENLRRMNLECATLFWTKVIPHSAHSLKELTVNSSFEGPWCYGPDASNALSQCTVLKKLTISLSRVPLYWAEEKAAHFKPQVVLPAPEIMSNHADDVRQSLIFASLGLRRDQQVSGSGPVKWGEIESTPVSQFCPNGVHE